MKLTVKTLNFKYDIHIEKDILDKVNKYIKEDGKILLLTDDGIPASYVLKVSKQFSNVYKYVIPQGEASKSITIYQQIITFMLDNQFTRNDTLISLGGGVAGDLGGFISSTFMRGIKFYNIPTTLLSQVDSSIGGKTAIDFQGYKNVIGTFYPPKMVLIDPNTLNTLPKRQLHAGLVEAIKMSLTCNKQLYYLIKTSTDLFEDVELIIQESLKIKKFIVENDEYEKGIRKVLNFGHSFGHAIESYSKMNLLHGECVGIGMQFVLDDEIKHEIKTLLEKYDLPTKCDIDISNLNSYLIHDKKANGNFIDMVFVHKIGEYEIKKVSFDEILKLRGW